jgi:hypothetical protein
VFSQAWPSIGASVLCALAFATAISLGWRLPSAGSKEAREASESRATRIALLGGTLLMLAAVLWLAYLILGPIHDAVTHIREAD